MALLTEIHYLFIQSPLDIEGESVLKLLALPWWSHTDVVFVCYSWKVVTVSSLTPDDSVDLRPGRWGWYLTLFATQFHFHTNSRFLSLSLSLPAFSQSLSLALQFTGSNTERCAPCLCAGCCCLIGRSPSRSSDIVVVCLYRLECVTCICPGSLEGVCFCSQCCKQGGAPFPNHSVGEGYFHTGVIFLFCLSFRSID